MVMAMYVFGCLFLSFVKNLDTANYASEFKNMVKCLGQRLKCLPIGLLSDTVNFYCGDLMNLTSTYFPVYSGTPVIRSIYFLPTDICLWDVQRSPVRTWDLLNEKPILYRPGLLLELHILSQLDQNLINFLLFRTPILSIKATYCHWNIHVH